MGQGQFATRGFAPVANFEPPSSQFQPRGFAAEAQPDGEQGDEQKEKSSLESSLNTPLVNIPPSPPDQEPPTPPAVQSREEESLQLKPTPAPSGVASQAGSLIDIPLWSAEQGVTAPTPAVQAKLTIGQPGDKYEQEADRTAAQVMAMPEPAIQPLPTEEADEKDLQLKSQLNLKALNPEDSEPLQPKSFLQAKGDPAPAPSGFENKLAQHKSKGKPLSKEARSFMEPRFGADFSGVRVHEAPQETGEIQAQAFTHGQDIYFNSGKYNPGSSSGKELLAHELTHVVQQTGGKLQPKANKINLKLNHLPTADLQARRQEPNAEPASSQPAGAANSTESLTQPEPNADAPSPTTSDRSTPAAAETTNLQVDVGQADPSDASPTQPSQQEQQSTPGAETTEGSETAGPSETAQTEAKAPETGNAPAEGEAPSQAPEGEATGDASSNQATGENQEAAQTGAGATAVQPGQASEASAAAGASNAAAEDTPSPPSPEADPDFQAAVAQSEAAATRKKQHAPAAAESQAAQAAAESPENEVTSQAQDQQVADMEQQEAGTFEAEAFKQAVMSQVDAAAPKTLEDADDFKDEGLLGKVKETLSGEAKSTSETAKAPIAEKTEQEPDTSGVTPREATPLAPPETGAPPHIDASAAKPKPKPESEVSAPMQAESQNLDQQMADAEITDEQLANSGESQFVGALSAKQEAQTKATEAPQIYRQQEQATLTSAQSEAQNIGQTEAQGMQSQREAAMSQLQGLQAGTKSQDEQKRSEVATHIDGIYQATKSAVNGILDGLEEEVMGRFNTGADQARSAYEDYVAPHMEEYKKRYDGIWGAGRWAKDKLFGVPSDVTAFFREGRKRYLEKMDEVLTDISTYVTDQLNLAKEKITEGRQEIKDYVKGLPTSLQQVGQEAASNIQSQFDELEQSVDDKHDQLVTALSQAYTKNLEELDARIEEMKASNQPWFAKAFDALAGVIETINKLKNMLTTVLAKVADTVGNIIKDPIGFLNNLVTGVTQGLNNFLGKIWDHLQGGLVGWLTGALGPMGITIPEDIFSLQGIFSLVTQVLGLTWNYVRGKAVKMFGEPTVGAMEQGVEMIQVVKEEGPEGMWEQVKEDFNDLQATVIDQIKNMVITQVITAGVKWIIGLLNPASAFVKACMAIYDIVMFFINQGSQILELVNAITDAVAAIAKGAVGGAAQLVEGALVKALPVAIGFLASLLGVSGLAKKVQGIIKKIRKRIDKAINKLLKKARKLFKGNKSEAYGANSSNSTKPEVEKQHQAFADQAIRELSETKGEPKEYEDLRREKISLAKSLESRYQPKLDKGIKIRIVFDDPAADKKDEDLDFKVVIAPNDTVRRGSSKPADLPSHRKVSYEWGHIFEGHWEGTPEQQRGNNTIFTGLNKEQIKRVVKGAYKNISKKYRTQGDRIKVRGKFDGWLVEMWVNKSTKTVETAYPLT